MEFGVMQSRSDAATGLSFAITLVALLSLPTGAVTADSDTSIATSDGSTTLYLGHGSVVVDSALTVTSADLLGGATAQIGDGWQTEDSLSCDEPSDALACVFDAGTGVLTVSGTATPAEWETLLRSVRLTTTSTVETARAVVFALGSAIPFHGSDHVMGHYYEFVNPCGDDGCGVTWSEAKTLAADRTLFGLHGYLATMTSGAETDFVAQRLGSDGWIGSSDDYREINGVASTGFADQSQAEGYWYWVTGPEAGTLISTDNGAPIAASYTNWAFGEPNNYPLDDGVLPPGEYYGEIYSSGGGLWNDLPGFMRLGYVVEYGDMAGDPVVQLSATKNVIVNGSHFRAGGGGSAIDPVLLGLLVARGALRRRRSGLPA
jgi:hypothetical protein